MCPELGTGIANDANSRLDYGVDLRGAVARFRRSGGPCSASGTGWSVGFALIDLSERLDLGGPFG